MKLLDRSLGCSAVAGGQKRGGVDDGAGRLGRSREPDEHGEGIFVAKTRQRFAGGIGVGRVGGGGEFAKSLEDIGGRIGPERLQQRRAGTFGHRLAQAQQRVFGCGFTKAPEHGGRAINEAGAGRKFFDFRHEADRAKAVNLVERGPQSGVSGLGVGEDGAQGGFLRQRDGRGRLGRLLLHGRLRLRSEDGQGSGFELRGGRGVSGEVA